MWSMIFCFAIICTAMYVGDVVSCKTNGKVPQMLIVALIFLVGFWTIFPNDILAKGNITPISQLMISFILIHIGTMFNLSQIKKEWKVVVITLCAVFGIVVLIFGFGTLFFGRDIALTAAAPMTGGGMAALIMDKAASGAGRPELGVLAMMIFIMHGFFGFPLTAFFLNKECKRLLKEYRSNDNNTIINPQNTDNHSVNKKIIEMMPKKYRTATFYIAQLGILALICAWITDMTGCNNAIVQVILGIILGHFGLIEDSPLVKTESFGILNLALLASFMGSFAFATPEVVGKFALQIIILMSIATVAIIVCCVPIGRKFGYSTPMSIAIGLNCFLGFPFNFALTNEAVKGNATNEAETHFLTENIMPKMIIAGIISVSIVSAILAGIIASILF